MSTHFLPALSRALRGAICVLLWMSAWPAAHAGTESWPQFWQHDVDAPTRAVLDESFRRFTSPSASSAPAAQDEQLYRRALLALPPLLERRAIARSRDPLVRLEAARAWLFVGALHARLNEIQACLEAERKGLALMLSTPAASELERAQTLSSVGNTWWVLGNADEAASLMERGLQLLDRQAAVPAAETERRLRLLATVYRAQRRFGDALPALERRLRILESMPGIEGAALAEGLDDLAFTSASLDDSARAISLYERSLVTRRRSANPSRSGIAETEHALADLYRKRSELAKALPLYLSALRMQEQLLSKDDPRLAVTLDGLAATYDSLGQHEEAIVLVRRGLEIREARYSMRSLEAATSLHNLAALYNNQRLYEDARPLYQRSLDIREALAGKSSLAVARTLNGLASLEANTGRNAEARKLLVRSVRILENTLGREDPRTILAWCDLAAVEINLGRDSRALPLALRAELAASRTGAPEATWRAQNLLSVIHANEGRSELAIFWGKQAVNSIQKLRASLTSLDEVAQRSFLNDKRQTYSHLASVLIQAGRIPEAQSVIRMLKENEYFELVRGSSSNDPRETDVPLTGVERSAHERYYQIRNQLASIARQYEQIESRRRAGKLTSDEITQVSSLRADLARAREAFNAFVGGLSKVLAADEESAQSVLALQQQIQTHRTLLNALGDARNGVATLQYVSSADRLHIILTTTSVQLAREVSIGRSALSSRITAFREVLQNPRIEPRPIGRELYAALIEPVRKDLEDQRVHTIMLFLDGALRYVPFAALVQPDGSYLTERYRLSVQTDAGRTALAQAPASQWQVAAFGATRPFPEKRFAALLAVRGELEGIVRADVLPGRIYLDDDFTIDALVDALENPVVHVGSHFRFLPGSGASFLLLGDGSTLTLSDIVASDLRFDAVDLLTLSACETAVGGGIDANGLEVEGLGVLAQKQGARAVLATLWPVADESTGVLMQHFYRERRGQQFTKAEALRQAQLQLIHGGSPANGGSERDAMRGAVRTGGSSDGRGLYSTSADAPYSHPYYWAPFILMGNWR